MLCACFSGTVHCGRIVFELDLKMLYEAVGRRRVHMQVPGFSSGEQEKIRSIDFQYGDIPSTRDYCEDEKH
jgi:hypothetical protein